MMKKLNPNLPQQEDCINALHNLYFVFDKATIKEFKDFLFFQFAEFTSANKSWVHEFKEEQIVKFVLLYEFFSELEKGGMEQ